MPSDSPGVFFYTGCEKKPPNIVYLKNVDDNIHTLTSGSSINDPNAGKLFDTSIVSPGLGG